jgi:DNA-directed RNA polymerase subunit M/transcription elongation factor TFIIS
MKVIDILRYSLETKRWDLIEKLIEKLNSVEEEQQPVQKSRETTPVRVNDGITTTIKKPEDVYVDEKYGRVIPIDKSKSKINKFVDDLSEDPELVRDNNPQVEILYGKSKERKRPPASKVHVKCSVEGCGYEDYVYESLAIGATDEEGKNRYKCNRCCARQGKENRE